MKKLPLILGSLVVLLIGGVAAAPFLIPIDTYKKTLTDQVAATTGRTLTLAGPVRVSLFPVMGLSAENVSLSNAPNAGKATMAEFEKLDVGVALLPLLQGKVQLSSFVLTRPVIHLETNKAGKGNWEFPAAAKTETANTDAQTAGRAGTAPLAFLSAFSLGDVRIDDGTLTFRDGKTGETQTLSGADVTLSYPSPAAPLSATASTDWKGKRINLDVRIEKPGTLAEGGNSPFMVKLASDAATFAANGTLTAKTAPEFAGRLEVSVPSVRDLIAWTAKPVTGLGDGLALFKVEGDVKTTAKTIALSNANLWFDKTKGQGDLLIATGNKPKISGNLSIDAFDLNTYFPPAAAGTQTTSAPAATPAAWSTDPMDLSGLRGADADLMLKAEKVTVQKMTAGPATLKATLSGGRLTLALTEAKLYEGQGRATLTLDGATATPAITIAANLTGINAQGLMKDAIGLDALEGSGALSLNLTGRGTNQKAIVESLAGQGDLRFANGAIRGINLAAMLRNVSTAFLNPMAGETQKTDFAELGGSFTMQNGIAQNNDLRLVSPLLRVEGAGQISLPARNVDYRLTPKLVASLQGQGTTGTDKGLQVPIRITGAFEKLSFKPDLTATVTEVIKDPKAALGQAKGLIDQVKNAPGGAIGDVVKDPAAALKGFLGQ